jgi:hypothetical protein
MGVRYITKAWFRKRWHVYEMDYHDRCSWMATFKYEDAARLYALGGRLDPAPVGMLKDAVDKSIRDVV